MNTDATGNGKSAAGTVVRAAKYARRGWAPIPIPPREKGPRIPKWQNLRLTEADVAKRFKPGMNIGVLLGEPSGWLIDVDLDHPLALELADAYLPPTGAVFGRAGNPRSHRLYRVPGGIQTHKRHTPDGAMIVELRSTGMQTVFPGSVHPSGEAVEWVDDGEPAEVNAATLVTAVDNLADAVQRQTMPQAELKTPRTTHKAASGAMDEGSRATRYVAATPGVAEGGRDNAAFKLAAKLCGSSFGDFRLSAAEARPLMQSWNERNMPPLLNRDLEKTLQSAAGRRGNGRTSTESRDGEPDDGQPAASALPEIRIGADEMRVTDETIAALANRKDIFQRAGVLVEIRESPEPPACIIRPEGGVRAVRLPEPRLRELIADSAIFTKEPSTKGVIETVPVPVPRTVVEQVDARGVWPGICSLEGIVTSPQFLLDGSILKAPGYHPRSALYLAAEPAMVPDAPSRADALRARDDLLEVVADLPLDDVGRAAWLAVVLTGASRHAIDGPTPLFAIDANVRGSGKSLAADAVGVIHTGRQLPRTTAASDDSEFRKRITAILLAGDPLVLLDNVSGVLGCASLDALLTANTWTDRLLGHSTMTAVLPATAIWLATGNNMQFEADTARRTLRIRLESPLENPEERTGFRHPDLLGWVRHERGRLAAAAVTILSAWHRAGRPDMGLTPWGSFDGWSRIVRAAVSWLDLPDPGETRQQVQRESDREAMLLRLLLDAWQDADPHGRGLTVGEAIKRSNDGHEGLEALFAELADRTGKVNPRGVGMKLSHLRGRV